MDELRWVQPCDTSMRKLQLHIVSNCFGYFQTLTFIPKCNTFSQNIASDRGQYRVGIRSKIYHIAACTSTVVNKEFVIYFQLLIYGIYILIRFIFNVGLLTLVTHGSGRRQYSVYMRSNSSSLELLRSWVRLIITVIF